MLLLGGVRVCFVISKEDAAKIHKSPSLFNRDHTLVHTTRQFGLSKKGARILCASQPGAVRRSKPLYRILEAVRREVASTNTPDGLPCRALEMIHSMLDQEHKFYDNISDDVNHTQAISLSAWVRDTFIKTSTHTLFGDAMTRINPNFAHDFKTFDNQSWMTFFGVPWPWSSKPNRALKIVQRSLEKYLEHLRSELDDGAQVMRHVEGIARAEHLSTSDTVSLMTVLSWG